MDTHGLNAFDPVTKRHVERLLDALSPRPKPPKVKAEPKPRQRKPRPEGRSTAVAKAWLEHKKRGGKTRKVDWARKHGVKIGTFSSALYYMTNPKARAAKNKQKRTRWAKIKSSRAQPQHPCPV